VELEEVNQLGQNLISIQSDLDFAKKIEAQLSSQYQAYDIVKLSATQIKVKCFIKI